MQRRKLGQDGPMVSAIGLGAMSFGGIFGATDESESLACLDAMLEAGIDFIDTANIYGLGVSETVIGRWLALRGHPKVAIATKAAIVPGPERRVDNSAAYLRAELDASLKRLGRDHIDLFYIHRREASRPVEEVADTLARLVDEGKIGGYGLSEVAPSTLRRAHAVHPCRAVQNEYSLWSRQPELGLIDTCAELGVAFVAFSPLGRGMFGDRPLALPQDEFRSVNPRFTEPNFSANTAAIDGFRAFARSRGWTTAAAALAWVLQRGDHVVAIPGTRYASHLAEWRGADAIRFTEADRATIARLLPTGFAHGDRYSDRQLAAVERYC